jgi:broad specificity phosphatase PhoE
MAAPQQRPTPKDKRRRRRQRIVSVTIFIVATLALAWFFELHFPTTILFVRHAETGAAMGEGGDPPLNAQGRARAELLADFLQNVDVIAGVDAIYVSEFQRTQQTAEPLAKRLELPIETADQSDIVGFMANVLHEHQGDIVLVVSHSNLIAPLVEELHGSKNLPEFGHDDFGELYIVTVPWWGKVKTLRLPYAIGWQPPYGTELPSSE